MERERKKQLRAEIRVMFSNDSAAAADDDDNYQHILSVPLVNRLHRNVCTMNA